MRPKPIPQHTHTQRTDTRTHLPHSTRRKENQIGRFLRGDGRALDDHVVALEVPLGLLEEEVVLVRVGEALEVPILGRPVQLLAVRWKKEQNGRCGQ